MRVKNSSGQANLVSEIWWRRITLEISKYFFPNSSVWSQWQLQSNGAVRWAFASKPVCHTEFMIIIVNMKIYYIQKSWYYYKSRQIYQLTRIESPYPGSDKGAKTVQSR